MIRTVPACNGSEWVEQPVIPLSLTFDHAAVYGAPTAPFLAGIVEQLGGIAPSSKESP